MDMVTEGFKFQMEGTVIPLDDAISVPKDWFVKLIQCGIIENPIEEIFRMLKHEFHPLKGHEMIETQLAYYLKPFVSNPIVRVGHISAGYNTIEYFAEGDKFMVSEKYLKLHPEIDLKNLAAELLISQREILKEYVLSKM
jgi:hypothetical protein